MYYRVDYMLAVMAAGFVLGALLARSSSRVEASRLARYYYIWTVFRAVVAGVVLAGTVVFPLGKLWSNIGGSTGDLSNLLFGALIGLAVFRRQRLDLFREPAVYSAFCLATAIAIVTAGLAKPFYMQDMIDFFAQSGYSLAFLKFIIIAEVLGGLALLVPWTVIPAVAGLTVDMVGAIYTHAHNGDPLNDSSGAIVMLFRLAAIAVAWALQPHSDAALLRKGRFAWISAGAVACLFVAIIGSAALRQAPTPAAAAKSSSDPPDALNYFVGAWHCSGTFARSGVIIEADLHFDKALDGKWLIFRHDDVPPHSYHAIAEWSQNGTEWTESLQDNFGGFRTFHSRGWDGTRLVWEGDSPVTQGPNPRQHFIFERTDPSLFELSYEVQQPGGSWRLVDSSACRRTG